MRPSRPLPSARVLSRFVPALGLAALAACSSTDRSSTSPAASGSLKSINHLVVIYLENRSFDNEYGSFAGANNLSSAASAPKQVDANGNVYATLPMPGDAGVPSNTLPNAPFAIDQFISPSTNTRDLVHRFYQEQLQIDGGKMDRFVSVSDAQGFTMGYFNTADLPLAAEARNYVLMDNFFHSAFGGSFLNHQFLIAARAPVFPAAPSSMVAQLDSAGNVIRDGAVTPDGYVVNTSFTVNTPHPASASTATLIPDQTYPTIGDRLTQKNVSWAWYSGGWNDAVAGHPASTFQFHHQPFAYFQNYADGTPAKAANLKDETDFIAAAQAGTLPAVSFVKPLGINNEHPGYSNVSVAEQHVEDLINAVRNGPNWKDAAIVITYDENGGQWDHVSPPKLDRWGVGTRVPALVISPWAKRGFVDKAPNETVSILRFIERRWGVAPLTARDSSTATGDLTTAFDFTQSH